MNGAIDPHDLATCVRCGLCLRACPTYGLTGIEGYSPRGRVAAAKAVARGAPTDRVVLREYLDTCLGCRACEDVCPSGVPYGRILEGVRAELGPSGGAARRAAEALSLWFVARAWRMSMVTVLLVLLQRLGVLRVLGRLWPATFGAAKGLPALRARDALRRLGSSYAPGEDVAERGSVVLFAGCVQDAWARDVHWATIAVLTRLGYRVRVPRGQVCCGALHAHAGRARTAHELAVANLEPFDRYEGPIVVNAAGCGAKLKEYGDVLGEAGRPFAARVRDVHEVLDPADVRRAVRGAPPLQRVAVHDPCHLAFAQGVRSQVRDLLAAAGYETVELGDAGRCCGAAGTYAVHHPEWAVPLRDEKVAACRDANADAVAVANPGCAFWMGAADGSPPMYHPIQLVAMAFASTEPSRGRS